MLTNYVFHTASNQNTYLPQREHTGTSPSRYTTPKRIAPLKPSQQVKSAEAATMVLTTISIVLLLLSFPALIHAGRKRNYYTYPTFTSVRFPGLRRTVSEPTVPTAASQAKAKAKAKKAGVVEQEDGKDQGESGKRPARLNRSVTLPATETLTGEGIFASPVEERRGGGYFADVERDRVREGNIYMAGSFDSYYDEHEESDTSRESYVRFGRGMTFVDEKIGGGVVSVRKSPGGR